MREHPRQGETAEQRDAPADQRVEAEWSQRRGQQEDPHANHVSDYQRGAGPEADLVAITHVGVYPVDVADAKRTRSRRLAGGTGVGRTQQVLEMPDTALAFRAQPARHDVE